MHAIYLLLYLCFNSILLAYRPNSRPNIKFKFKLYCNYIKIVYIIIYYLFINQYLYNQLES